MQIRKNYLSVLTAIVFFVLASTSCRTTQKIQPINPPVDIPIDTTSKRQTKIDSVFLNMKKAELKFDYLQSKFSAHYDSETQKINFDGQIRIRKDSAIWVSITPMLGIELYRVLITQDSIKMLDKLKKTFIAAPIGYMNQTLNTNIDFDMLQSLIIGMDFPYYETNVFEMITLGNDIFLSTMSRKKLRKVVAANDNLDKVLVQNMKIDKNNLKLQKQIVKQVKDPNKKIEIDYKNYQMIMGQLFPQFLDIKVEDKTIILMNLEYSKTVIDEELSFPMKVPPAYTYKVLN